MVYVEGTEFPVVSTMCLECGKLDLVPAAIEPAGYIKGKLTDLEPIFFGDIIASIRYEYKKYDS